MSSSLSMPATGAIIQSVSQTKGAIGYVGLAYVSPRVKTLAVSYDNGMHYAHPVWKTRQIKLTLSCVPFTITIMRTTKKQ